ncbi:hypothetical protein Ddye_001667 [Dipteronia dyeriana]|uniref:MULE transposase domain-containing protein n=1 Tax=Dipteronia dyeriana TaxID=168575 RepID=A0AAD9XPL9_9ROSI|nr:hypothetical protein Ddye_001667 [Dipteronia dyeriana]
MDHFVDQAGSYSNVGHTKKDLQNRLDSVQMNELQSSDIDYVISYLTVKMVIDPDFFFEYTSDEGDRFGNLFWADSTSHSGYGYFGDVLAFDATYKTNMYRRTLVMLVGVNHHKSTTIFGFGLLGDETVEIYTWLLRTFLVSMHGKMPQSVVTDGDKAMHKAIKTVMPNSVRRLCCWQLEHNVQVNIQDENFTRAFYSSMLTYMTVEDFELKRKNMVVKFRLNNNEWLNVLYSKRKLRIADLNRQREIEKLTVRMQELMSSSPLTSETVLCSKGKQHVYNVRDPGITATKGSNACKKNCRCSSSCRRKLEAIWMNSSKARENNICWQVNFNNKTVSAQAEQGFKSYMVGKMQSNLDLCGAFNNFT